MTKKWAAMLLYDDGRIGPLGEKDIPDDVIDAAAKVAAWLREQPISMELHGLGLMNE